MSNKASDYYLSVFKFIIESPFPSYFLHINFIHALVESFVCGEWILMICYLHRHMYVSVVGGGRATADTNWTRLTVVKLHTTDARR